MTVMAIIATASILAIPYFQEWGAKKSFEKSINEIYSELSQTRLEAFSRGTTTRITTSRDNDEYTLIMYYNDTPVDNCAAAGGWNVIKTTALEFDTHFEATGSGIGNICFYRDGTSTGGAFSIDQKDAGVNLGSADISVVLTTGFIDVIKN